MSERFDIWAALQFVMDEHGAALSIHGGGEEECEAELSGMCAIVSHALACAERLAANPSDPDALAELTWAVTRVWIEVMP